MNLIRVSTRGYVSIKMMATNVNVPMVTKARTAKVRKVCAYILFLFNPSESYKFHIFHIFIDAELAIRSIASHFFKECESTRFFYKQRFFKTQPQCCLTF